LRIQDRHRFRRLTDPRLCPILRISPALLGASLELPSVAWQLLLFILAGWVNQQQQQVIDYLRTENQILKENLGKRRLLRSDDQRRRLAVKAKVLGRMLLAQVGTLVTPDALLRWHRMLVVTKWGYSTRRARRPGRPPVAEEIRQWVVRLAQENPTWGYDRIQGALANLGHTVFDSSVANILKAHGIEPAPQRQRTTTWRSFLQAHSGVLAAIDFTTLEVWSKQGLVTLYLLFVMEEATRRVHFAGCTPHPTEAWMKQVARNLAAVDIGFLQGQRYLLMDRDTKFTEAFRGILAATGTRSVVLPARAPNRNANLERFHRSVKEECLERLIFFGEAPLRRAVTEYLAHYHGERNHQGLDNRLLEESKSLQQAGGPVLYRERLGGLLKFYHRQAA
jgi:transposase InsO family protein